VPEDTLHFHICTDVFQCVTYTDTFYLFSHDLSSSAKGSRCIPIRAHPPPQPITAGYGMVLGCWCSHSFMIKFSATGSFSQNFTESWSVFVGKQRSSPSRWWYCHILVGRSWFSPLPTMFDTDEGAWTEPSRKTRPRVDGISGIYPLWLGRSGKWYEVVLRQHWVLGGRMWLCCCGCVVVVVLHRHMFIQTWLLAAFRQKIQCLWWSSAVPGFLLTLQLGSSKLRFFRCSRDRSRSPLRTTLYQFPTPVTLPTRCRFYRILWLAATWGSWMVSQPELRQPNLSWSSGKRHSDIRPSHGTPTRTLGS